jgi:hypothetical protein
MALAALIVFNNKELKAERLTAATTFSHSEGG